MKMTMKNMEEQRKEEAKEEADAVAKEKNKKNDEPVDDSGYVSSGLESDNDLALLIEQDTIRSQRMRARK